MMCVDCVCVMGLCDGVWFVYGCVCGEGLCEKSGGNFVLMMCRLG